MLWAVSANAGPWGSSVCPSGYTFDYPRNAAENQALLQKTNYETVWLNYQAVTPNAVAVAPSSLTFSMPVNGAPPAAQSVILTAPAGTVVSLGSSGSWIQLPGGSVTVPAGNKASVPIAINSSASQLPNGVQSTTIVFTASVNGVPGIASLAVQLQVQQSTSVTVQGIPNPAGEMHPVDFIFQVNGRGSNGPLYAGTVDLRQYSVDPVSGNTTVTTLVKGIVVDPIQGTGSAALPQLPNGANSVGAVYSGSAAYLPSSSGVYMENVTPFYSASPTSVSQTFPYRAPPTGVVSTIAFTPFVSGAQVLVGCPQQPCPWLKPSLVLQVGNTLNAYLQYDIGAATLIPGSYQATVTIQDGLHVPFAVPFQLGVTGNIHITPSQVNLVASASPAGGEVQATATASGSIPLSATISTKNGGGWLSVIGLGVTPATVGIVATPAGLTAGNYSGTVTFASPLAAATSSLQVFLTVVPQSTVDTSPTGLPVTVDNVQYTAPATFTWTPGSKHTLSAVTPITQDYTRYDFTSWSDAGQLSHTVVAPTHPADTSRWVASYSTSYHLEADPVPTGSGSIQLNPVPTSDGYYPANTPVQVTAVPAAGNSFTGFSGALNGLANPQTIVMSQPQQVTAAFVPTNTLPVTTVETSVAGLQVTVDNQPYTSPSTFQWVPQTQHTISVSTPQHGGTGTRYVFHKWSDGVTQVSRTVTAANANTLYEAMFGKQYLLTVTANPSNGGAVSGGGWHNAGTTVTVQATANTGFAFTGFSGGLTGTANPQQLVMTKRYNVVANFAPAP